MTARPSFPSECLDENAILALVRGEGSPGAIQHVDECDECQVLVGCAVKSASGSRNEISATRPVGASDESAPKAELARLRASLLPRGAQVRRYRVIRAIGAGAMGIVYEAHDPELDRRVALKLLQTHDEHGAARLYREAQSLARVSHPNVIPVFDVGTYGEQVFMAMEFVDGSSLSEWLLRSHPWQKVRDAFVEAGRGLAVAHDKGLVHRDFKPDNVLVGNDGRVRVVDFGLASSSAPKAPEQALAFPELAGRADRSLTRTGALMGTPAYMAPEQYRGEAADARSDQFAFAVALYEAMYGERPFHAASLEEQARAVIAGDVRTPKSTRGVPRHIQRAIARGLSAAPSERHASMHDFLAELSRSERSLVAPVAGAVALLVGIAGISYAVATRTPAKTESPVALSAKTEAPVAAPTIETPPKTEPAATAPAVPAKAAEPVTAPRPAVKRVAPAPVRPAAPRPPAAPASEYLPTTP